MLRIWGLAFMCLSFAACTSTYLSSGPPLPTDADTGDDSSAPHDTAPHDTAPHDAGNGADAHEAGGGRTETTGLYYGACLAEIAFGDPAKVFNFYVQTKLESEGSDQSLALTMRSLAVVANAPPSTVSSTGAVGTAEVAPGTAPDENGNYPFQLDTIVIPASANPVSGSEMEIQRTTLLVARFGKTTFCARLGGDIVKPSTAARTLAPEKNICQFVAITDGATTPAFASTDFQASACPVVN